MSFAHLRSSGQHDQLEMSTACNRLSPQTLLFVKLSFDAEVSLAIVGITPPASCREMVELHHFAKAKEQSRHKPSFKTGKSDTDQSKR